MKNEIETSALPKLANFSKSIRSLEIVQKRIFQRLDQMENTDKPLKKPLTTYIFGQKNISMKFILTLIAILFINISSSVAQTATYSSPQQSTNVSGGTLTFQLDNIESCIVSDVTLVVEISGDLDGNCGTCPCNVTPTNESAEVIIDGVSTGIFIGNTDAIPGECSTNGSACPLVISQTITIPCDNQAKDAINDGEITIVFDSSPDVNFNGGCGVFNAEIISFTYDYFDDTNFPALATFGPYCPDDPTQVISANVGCGYEGTFSGLT